jgi:dTDP-glucose 4,6-dehydratase
LFITNALNDQPLPLYGDGRQIRDWIHVEDHARALLEVLDHGSVGEIYNISAGREESNERMASRLLDLLGKPKTLIRYVEDRPGHDRRYALDGAKIHGELGWRPKVSLAEGLQSTIDWYRDHRSWWERIKTGEYRDYYARWYGKRLTED